MPVHAIIVVIRSTPIALGTQLKSCSRNLRAVHAAIRIVHIYLPEKGMSVCTGSHRSFIAVCIFFASNYYYNITRYYIFLLLLNRARIPRFNDSYNFFPFICCVFQLFRSFFSLSFLIFLTSYNYLAFIYP